MNATFLQVGKSVPSNWRDSSAKASKSLSKVVADWKSKMASTTGELAKCGMLLAVILVTVFICEASGRHL